MLKQSTRMRKEILYIPPLAEAGFAGAIRIRHSID
jgi:hypothetical protein